MPYPPTSGRTIQSLTERQPRHTYPNGSIIPSRAVLGAGIHVSQGYKKWRFPHVPRFKDLHFLYLQLDMLMPTYLPCQPTYITSKCGGSLWAVNTASEIDQPTPLVISNPLLRGVHYRRTHFSTEPRKAMQTRQFWLILPLKGFYVVAF